MLNIDITNNRETRWGSQEIIDEDDDYIYKILYLKKEKHTSLQRHPQSEVMTILSGTGFIVNEDGSSFVSKNDIVEIKANALHKIIAITDLIIREKREKKEGETERLDYDLNKSSVGKTYCFDIDGTVCTQEEDYRNARPYKNRIAKINNLWENGGSVIYFTARGTETKIDWSEITKEQFIKWGIRYDNIIFGKPAADFYIDDKAKTLEFFKGRLDD